ncbi:MAG: oligosaccharide flippase family protein [Mobilitalea sp.]
MKNKLAMNFLGNLLAYIVTFSIGFFISPYIIKTVGTEAYGFVSLAINFVNYISLLTVALNSMASRFVSIKIFKKDYEKANEYFNSVIIANSVIILVLTIPSILCIIFLEKMISIPLNLVFDVKILFLIVFLSFFISLLTSLLSVAVFVENKLYLNAKRNVEGSIIRCFFIVLLFKVFAPRVYFVSVAALIVSLYSIFWNFYYTRKFLPSIRLSRAYFRFKSIKELIASGVWNLVNQLCSLLYTGFDLLLTNQLINSFSMGVLSISATMPSIINSVLMSVASVFDPDLTKGFAEKSQDQMMKTLGQSIKILGIVLAVPLAGFAVLGDSFYRLWMPMQDARELQILSILKVMILVFTGSTASIHEIFIIANKLKPKAIVSLITAIISFCITYILLKTTNLGLFAVAGVSTTIGILQNYCFTFPYAAKIMKQKWYVFYRLSFRGVFCFCLNAIIFFLVKKIFVIDNWMTFILVGIICGILGLLANAYVVLNKSERTLLFNKIRSKF